MSNLRPNCYLKVDFQKVDQHAGGKWLIHDTKRRKDNQLQSLLQSPAEYPSWVARWDIKGSDGKIILKMIYLTFHWNLPGANELTALSHQYALFY